MRKFHKTRLWEMLIVGGNHISDSSSEFDVVLDEFILELHNYCRNEPNIAERTRTLNYARNELEGSGSKYTHGAGKKRSYTTSN